MRGFDPNTVIELAKEGFGLFLWTQLEFTGTHYYQNSEIPIYEGGELYLPTDFTHGGINTSGSMGVDSVSLQFGDPYGAMKSIVLSEDVRGKTSTLGFFAMGASAQVVAFETLFVGIVDDWEIKEDIVTIDIKNELILWRKETLRTCQSSCRWEFKGLECAYSGGGTWCDQTYERCGILLNTDNFGGFRWLPALEELDIWWGRIPDKRDL